MDYQEHRWIAAPYRAQYADGIKNLISELQKQCDQEREAYTCDILNNTEKYRDDFKKMLGYPLNEKFDTSDIPEAKKELVAREKDFDVYRVQLEVLPDLWFYGLLYRKHGDQKRPAVIVQHGGLGTCEIITGMYPTSNYNDAGQRILAYDVNIFAPQLLLWQKEVYGYDYDRKAIDSALKQVGSSITAIEVYAIMKTINWLCDQDFTDSEKIGMVGLSYGGFYTLFTAAADTRIKAALSTAFFNNRYIHNSADWIWDNSASKFLDAEVAALCCPRYLGIAIGDKDPLFIAEEGRKEFDRLKDICRGKTDWVNFEIFEGVHEFPLTSDALDAWYKNLA